MSDALTLLIRDMRRESLLIPRAEQLALARRYRATGCPDAKDKLVKSVLRLVVSIVLKKYRGRGGTLADVDLIQEGVVGAIRAVEKFDPDRGFALSTYCTHWVRQAVDRAIDNSSRVVRLPVHRAAECRRYAAIERRLATQLGCTPALEEIAKAGGWPVDHARELRDLDRKPIPLELPIGEDGSELRDVLPDESGSIPAPFDAAAASTMGDALQAALADLPYRSRRIVELRYLEPQRWTLDDVAEHFQIQRERARLIEVDALAALREGRHAVALAAEVGVAA